MRKFIPLIKEMTYVTTFLLAAALARPTSAIDFTEIARFDVDSTANPMNTEYIGSNPSAVAWSGSRLYLAGFNNDGNLQNTGLIEVLSATSTGIISTPSYSAPLQTILTRAFRGYASLDISADGGSLAVAYDDGEAFAEGFQVYDTASGTQRWNFNERGSSGAAFDPGFSGVDAGTAFGAFGSGRRQLYDTTTGNQIYGTTNGFIWYDNNGPGTFVRDMDFDPDTGDVYVRHNNQVSKATRNGGNSAMPGGVIVPLADAPFVSHQNISFLNNTSEGDLLIYNDRPDSLPGKEFVDTIKVADTSGAAVTANFTFLNGDIPAAGSGWFDFDYDPNTGTLALVDNSNRNVHIFEVGGVVSLACDFTGDDLCDGADIDLLIENIAIGPPDPNTYDLTGDGMVNTADRDRWLELAGAENLPSGNPYLLGDANLDGSVDGQDFIAWNDNKFTSVAAWTQGDFSADGSVDGQDFILWNDNKFTSADTTAVPEPATCLILMIGMGLLGARARR